MALDFKEIPEANKGGGLQDTFELFARDVLSYLGYRIVEDPDRGADGKRDLIVEEVLQGVNSEHTLRWLVSCKHYAHSGKAVSDADEINISERLVQRHCQGFWAFILRSLLQVWLVYLEANNGISYLTVKKLKVLFFVI